MIVSISEKPNLIPTLRSMGGCVVQQIGVENPKYLSIVCN